MHLSLEMNLYFGLNFCLKHVFKCLQKVCWCAPLHGAYPHLPPSSLAMPLNAEHTYLNWITFMIMITRLLENGAIAVNWNYKILSQVNLLRQKNQLYSQGQLLQFDKTKSTDTVTSWHSLQIMQSRSTVTCNYSIMLFCWVIITIIIEYIVDLFSWLLGLGLQFFYDENFWE